ncbi:MAG: ATP-binding protein [Cuspidothrix sp.]
MSYASEIDNNHQLKMLISQNADGIMVVDLTGVVRFVNPAAELILNRSESALIGNLLGFPISMVDRSEIDIISANGKNLIAEMRIVDINWENEPAFLISLRDITEYKLITSYLTRRNIELEKTIEELEIFSYSLSHDLWNYLRRIGLLSQKLLDKDYHSLSSESQEWLKQIGKISHQTKSLIESLLQLSRVSYTKLNRQVFDLSNLAQDVINQIQLVNIYRPIKILINENIQAYGDPRLIRIALDNLLVNAWKYTETCQEPMIEFGQVNDLEIQDLSLLMNIEFPDNYSIFFVRDNGVGFEITNAQKLFQPFQRLHSRECFPGDGIGLATVRRVIQRHGGKVWAKGEVNKGAIFYFSLPSK